MTSVQIISICVFVGVMALIISERTHRALAALLGASIVIIAGVIPFSASVEAIDFNTLGVLLGMMLFVSVVKASGIFEFIAIEAAKLAKGNPWIIMISFAVITALLSAMLDNVTTVLLIGPMTVMVCMILDLNPVPFFLVEIIFSNIGGTATLIGDPPNIMIGSASGLSFADFVIYNGPAVVLVSVVTLICFRFMYGRKMHVSDEAKQKVTQLQANKSIKDMTLFKISIVMIILVAIAFMLHGKLHLESSVIALSAAVIIMLVSRFNLEEAIKGVEWSTIIFFLGLFIVVGAMEHTGVIGMLADLIFDVTHGNTVLTMIIILWASAILSAFLDNIPFTATVIPIILALQGAGMDVLPLWVALSLGACLGGNGTLVGASANVVLTSMSEREGHPITFLKFFKVGFPMMILSVAVCTVYMLVIF